MKKPLRMPPWSPFLYVNKNNKIIEGICVFVNLRDLVTTCFLYTFTWKEDMLCTIKGTLQICLPGIAVQENYFFSQYQGKSFPTLFDFTLDMRYDLMNVLGMSEGKEYSSSDTLFSIRIQFDNSNFLLILKKIASPCGEGLYYCFTLCLLEFLIYCCAA